MGFKIDTLEQQIEQIKNDVMLYTQSSNLATDSIAFAQAGAIFGLYSYQQWLSRQIVPHLSESEFLLEYCNFWGVWRKLPESARGTIILTLTGVAEIEFGTQWQRADGVIFESTESLIGQTGAVTVAVKSIDTGADSNTSAGTQLNLISPIINVTPIATVDTSSLSGGADLETIDSLRSRLLFRVQYPPSGGTKYDYERWALECAGVTRAWCVPAPVGINRVTVIIVFDNRVNIFPTPTDLLLVTDYINGHVNPTTSQWEGAPPCTEVVVIGPEKIEINPVLKIQPDLPETRAAVAKSLTEFFNNSAPNGVLYLSALGAAISTTTGVRNYVLQSPAADITATVAELPVLGEITWI